MEVTDNQHVDLGKSRVDRDLKDLVGILDYLNIRNPFNTNDDRLRSIASGLVACDSHLVSCDNAEEIGALIMSKMDELAFADVVLKKADQIKTLASLAKKMKVSQTNAVADNSLLFNRLLVIMSRLKTTDLEIYFQYELTTVPTALFTDHGMRKTNKAALTKELRKNLKKTPMLNELPQMHVIDGGCLLHRVIWAETGTYADIAKLYVNFVRKHYGESCIIVFDGYNSGPSVKDQEHVRRAKNCSPVIDLNESNPIYKNQSAFLMNARNKQSLVQLLSVYFQQQNYEVRHAENDADTVIVGCAIQLARQLIPVTVIADDTDVLVLLVYHFQSEMADIFMLSEITRQRSPRAEITPVRDIRQSIGDKAACQLLLAHAISGCDTTSSLFGHGKSNVSRTLAKCDDSDIETLGSPSALRQQVIEAGLRVMSLLYGGKTHDSLNHLRYISCMHLLATSAFPSHPMEVPVGSPHECTGLGMEDRE
jgi:hypothetical protein